MKYPLTYSFLLLLLILPMISNFAFASPYVWNQTPIQVTWNTIPIGTGMTINDFNGLDGKGSEIFTLSGNTKLVHQFGSLGVSSFDISLGTARGILAARSNEILAWYQKVGGTGTCSDAKTIHWDISSGTNFTSTLLSQSPNDGNARTAIVGMINQNGNTVLICAEGGANKYFVVAHDPAISVNETVGSAGFIGLSSSPIGIFGDTNTHAQRRALFYNNVEYSSSPKNNMSSNTASPLIYPFVQNGILFSTSNLGTIPANLFIDPEIVRYFNGLRVPTTTLPINPNGIQSFLSTPSSSNLQLLANIPPVLLNPIFVTPPTFFELTDGTITYFAAIFGTNLYYVNENTLLTQVESNKALANYIIDPSNAFLTRTVNGSQTTKNILIYFHNGTSIGYAAPEQTVLPTGYYWQVPSETRYYYPDFTNSLVQMPTDTFLSTTALWTLIISNAPSSGAIMLNNATNYNGTNPYVNSVTFLQADKSTTTSLVNNACYNVYIDDSSVPTPIWLLEGQVCASGVNPKTIAFTNTLPLTFFTLKYGATNSYNPTNNGLSTTVRASTPITYNVIVKNSTGAVAINQTFSINGTIDTRNFNVSSVTKPASLFISVSGVGQIYSAYLGSPLSFATTAAFFHQYLSYQGFDFLSFIPLIFASMFTRNTVGIGAAMTVVLIATLSWLSVVVISDQIIFIMIIIAAIGLIGYRAYGT